MLPLLATFALAAPLDTLDVAAAQARCAEREIEACDALYGWVARRLARAKVGGPPVEPVRMFQLLQLETQLFVLAGYLVPAYHCQGPVAPWCGALPAQAPAAPPPAIPDGYGPGGEPFTLGRHDSFVRIAPLGLPEIQWRPWQSVMEEPSSFSRTLGLKMLAGGQWVVSTGEQVRRYAFSDGRPSATIVYSGAPCAREAFVGDEVWASVKSPIGERCTVERRRLRDGKRLATFDVKVTALAAAGDRVVFLLPDRLEIRARESGAVVRTLTGRWYGVKMSPDGAWLVADTGGGSSVFSLEAGTPPIEVAGSCTPTATELYCASDRMTELTTRQLANPAVVVETHTLPHKPSNDEIYVWLDGRVLTVGGMEVRRGELPSPTAAALSRWRRTEPVPARRTLSGFAETFAHVPVVQGYVWATTKALSLPYAAKPSPVWLEELARGGVFVAGSRLAADGTFRLDVPADVPVQLSFAGAEGTDAVAIPPGGDLANVPLVATGNRRRRVTVVDAAQKPVARARLEGTYTDEDGSAWIYSAGWVAVAGDRRSAVSTHSTQVATLDAGTRPRCRLLGQDGNPHAAAPSPFWCDEIAAHVPQEVASRIEKATCTEVGCDFLVPNRLTVTFADARVQAVALIADDGTRWTPTLRDFVGVPPGRYRLLATIPTFTPPTHSFSIIDTFVETGRGDTTRSVTAPLSPRPSARVRVLDAEGVPLNGVQVPSRDPLLRTWGTVSANMEGWITLPADDAGRVQFALDEDGTISSTDDYGQPAAPPASVRASAPTGRAAREVQERPPAWWAEQSAEQLLVGTWTKPDGTDPLVIGAQRWGSRHWHTLITAPGALYVELGEPWDARRVYFADTDTIVLLGASGLDVGHGEVRVRKHSVRADGPAPVVRRSGTRGRGPRVAAVLTVCV